MRSLAYSVFMIVTATCFAQNPRLPPDWEAQSDTRFKPPIEETAYRLSFLPTKQDCSRAEYDWARWGPDAIPVVLQLRDSPYWSDFRHAYTILLCLCPFEEANAVRVKLFFDALGAEPGTPDALLKPSVSAAQFLTQFIEYNQRAGLAFVRQLARHESPMLQLMAASRLDRLSGEDRATADRLIDTHAQSEDAALRERVVGILLARMDLPNCNRALELSESLPAESQATIQKQIEAMQGNIRANEPMSSILARENEQGAGHVQE